ncbi:MAG: TIGR03619 family F420-dependent LLM class oxidoreductase [Spirochaetaceae bacterium]|nr:TIGR03619 family F420-dependent LLM class oxidoreductase [Spirochaetaceae bacterium]
MPKVHSVDAVTPALSIQPVNFSAKDPGVGGWRFLMEQAKGADAAGIDRLVVSDHVILGENLEAYGDPKTGGMTGGVQPTGPDGHWLDPLVVLSMWAAVTTHTRFMTGILIAALRRPATLAKQLSTLEVLSEGRLEIGVGVGWQREEYEANGVEYEGRGKLLDQTLEICQTLWRDESAAYRGDGVAFEKIHLNPKPLQPCGVPFWISGRLNKNVLRRIARFGSGWIPWGEDAMNPVAGLAQIREALEAAGRDAKGFQVQSYIPVATGAGGKIDVEKTMSVVPAMVEGGITDHRITLDLPKEQAAVEDYLAPLVESFRKAAGRRG